MRIERRKEAKWVSDSTLLLLSLLRTLYTLRFLIKKVPLSYFTSSAYLEQVALFYFY